MTRRGAVLALAAIPFFPRPAAAGIVLPPQLVAIGDRELAEARGGFAWGTMSISFGADIQTFVDGRLALRTLVDWTPAGNSVRTMIGQAFAGDAAAGLSTGAAGVSLNEGRTLIVQNGTGALQNLLVNSAPNLQAVQRTDAVLGLSNYPAFSQSLRTGLVGASLARDVAVIAR